MGLALGDAAIAARKRPRRRAAPPQIIDAIEVGARAETRRRTRNFPKFAKFEANETRSVPNANKAPTIKLWASQNGAPTRKRPFIRVVEVCSLARLPNELPVNANADGIPCHVTTERKDNTMRLAP